LILRNTITGGEKELNLETLPKRLYLLEVNAGGKIEVVKLLMH